MISGRGYIQAKIMLVADGCSEEDIGTGYALSGYTEQKTLKGYCHDNGIHWDSLWLTALIKERINLRKPKENEHFLEDPKWGQILQGEITTVRPNVIVPLSELSFRYLTRLSGIRKFRGSVLPASLGYITKPTRIIPVLGVHPYLNEDYKLHFISRLDFGKVAKNMDSDGPILEIGNTWVAKSAGQFREFLERQWLKKPEYVIFDIETTNGIPHCISVCMDGHESCTAPFLDPRLSLDERTMIIRMVAQLLAQPISKINQNIKFDWKKLERFGWYVQNVQGDTLLAASCLYCEFPKNLGFLTSLYTDMPYFKDEGKQYDPTVHNRDKLYLYCAKDSLATYKIYRQQKQEIKELGVEGPYNNLIRILPIYKRAEERGIRIDEERRNKLRSKYTTLFDMQVFKAQRLTNIETFNPLSPAQVRNFVYKDLNYKKLREIKNTSKGEPSVDEESLELLMWKGHCDRPNGDVFLKTFINCRKLHKVIEYIETPIHPDSRMRSEFNLGGSENGRTTASSTTDSLMVIEKKKVVTVALGRSFQTIAKHGFQIDGEDLGKDLRSMFVPSFGYSFVELDLSQAEARVDAVLASDYSILPVFDSPTGIHRLTGSWIFNCAPQDIKKGLVNGVDRYYLSKTARHAAERNMKEERLMLMVMQPLAECRRILTQFHNRQPNIKKVFHKEIYEHLEKERLLVAPNGRRRDFYGRFDHHMVNEGISFLPQAIVTDYLKYALGPTFEKCTWAIPLNEAHDGFLSEVPLGREKEFASVFKENVEVPIDFRTCTLSRDYELTIPSETEWSKDSWEEMEKLEL